MRKNLDKFMNKPNTKIVILTLTNNCNLNCTYCYEHNKELRTMSIDTAIEIVDREMNADDGSDFVCFYYFGGEPYLEFEKIKTIHTYLQRKVWKKNWFGFTTTNGTLVHGEIKKWLKDNTSSIEVYISLDGNREMHNQNRSNSFDLIDIDFFVKEFPFAKMTITNETLPQLASGIIRLHELGFEVSANLGYGITWKKESPSILSEQLQILMNFYLEHPNIKPATILNVAILDMEPESKHPKRFCGVGPLMKSYDIDGEVYPCHAFAPLCIGKDLSKKARKLDFSCPLVLEELDEKCRNCPIVGVCPTCYGINFGAFGNVYKISNDHCMMMKVLFLINAKFKYEQYNKGLLKLSPEEEYKLLKNICMVQTLAD